jgi:hypothetical protein
MIPRRIAFKVLSLAMLAFAAGSSQAQTYTLDSFETPLRVVQPSSTDPAAKYLWGTYLGASQPASIVTADKADGASSLKASHGSGSEIQVHLYTYTEGLSGWTNGWKYLRNFANNPGMSPSGGSPAWPLNRINRLRFWVKLPPGYNYDFPANNVEFGTYIRRPSVDESVAESDNQHYYHYLDLRSHGQWEQVIIDTHPDHQRGDAGSTETKDNPQIAVAGYNYFDQMTRFYFHIFNNAVPGDILFDGFEFYEEKNVENTAQVRSVHAVYIPSGNTIEVGWRRPKNENGINHEVRYSFSSIHDIGWANASVPANGTVLDQGDNGYNGMRWSSSAINVSGHSVIYIAIKPTNSSTFRQIAIPTTAATLLTPKAPPTFSVN